MVERDTNHITDISLSIDFSTAITEEIPAVPDAFEILMERENERGEAVAVHYAYASLEQLFLVLELIEKEESGRVNFGTSGIRVQIVDESIILKRQFNICGDHDKIRNEIESLIQQAITELQQSEIDLQSAIDEIATGRFAPWHIGLTAIQDRLVD